MTASHPLRTLDGPCSPLTVGQPSSGIPHACQTTFRRSASAAMSRASRPTPASNSSCGRLPSCVGTCSMLRSGPGSGSLRRRHRHRDVVAIRCGMQLELTDEEAAALLALLNRAIEDDRYPLSPRVRMLRAIRAKLPGAPSEPPPARPPTPEERTPGRAPRAGRPRR